MGIIRRIFVIIVIVNVCVSGDESSDCFVKWVHGYRLASGRPQKILHGVGLEVCKQECASTPGCAAFAFGPTPVIQQRSSSSSSLPLNSTICELAINSRSRTTSQSDRSPPSSSSSSSSSSSNYRFFNPRDGRSVGDDSNKNATISIQDLDREPTYDVYIENPNSNEPCYKRDALYEPSNYPVMGNHLGPGSHHHHHSSSSTSSGGVPIDCFYRLMSGKRLVKTHTLRAISVNSLQECQEACINERSFNCRSISYRYMPSTGYSYPVSNCEMSSYYMQSGTISSSYSKLDFVEDYDYDFFQRETHCKTTSSTTLGVCAVVVRRGGRVSTTLIKSSHHTVTSSQCEHLCATSLFRCRAFSFRHTTRGRDPYSRYPVSSAPTRDLPPADHSCLLYDTDLSRLPSYNIEPDQDFDLFEMGRLMGAECVLYEQFLNRRPGYYNPGPVTSTYPPYDSNYRPEERDFPPAGGNRHYGQSGGSGSYGGSTSSTSSRDPPPRDMMGGGGASMTNRDQHPHGTGMNYLINREREQYGGGGSRHREQGDVAQSHHHHHHNQYPPPPPSTLETGLMIGGGSGGGHQQHHNYHDRDRGQYPPYEPPRDREHGSRPALLLNNDRNATSATSSGGPTQTPFYDKGKESCLRVFRQDAYLIPEVSRATFPVKTVDECRVECIRSLEVLRFACRAMAFRHTSHTNDRVGGTCQLSDQEPREPDLIQSRDRYEGAVTMIYDDREPGCGRGGYGAGGGGSGGYGDRDRYYEDRGNRGNYPGYVDYYGQDRNRYEPPYHQDRRYDQGGQYDRDRYRYPPPSPTPTYYPPSNRYYDQQSYDRRWSTSSNTAAPPANYNPHYWDYHNRYAGSSSNVNGGGGKGGYYNNNNQGGYYNEYSGGQGGTTVNGERCMRTCRQNRDAGFYYCQIDEQGAWDFCCRPDHFCGYSKGLSVPWCYVGTGPSQNIWRSCEAKGSRNNPFFSSSPHVAYLHDRLPPTVYSLTSTQVANLTKDNAIRLFTNNTIEDLGSRGDSERFVAKPIHHHNHHESGGAGAGSSQEVIVRISNSTADVLNDNKSAVAAPGKSPAEDKNKKKTR